MPARIDGLGSNQTAEPDISEGTVCARRGVAWRGVAAAWRGGVAWRVQSPLNPIWPSGKKHRSADVFFFGFGGDGLNEPVHVHDTRRPLAVAGAASTSATEAAAAGAALLLFVVPRPPQRAA